MLSDIKKTYCCGEPIKISLWGDKNYFAQCYICRSFYCLRCGCWLEDAVGHCDLCLGEMATEIMPVEDDEPSIKDIFMSLPGINVRCDLRSCGKEECMWVSENNCWMDYIKELITVFDDLPCGCDMAKK